MTNQIHCPFCGDTPEPGFIYTDDDWHELECYECGRCYSYKLTEFTWESWDDDYIGQPELQAGDSKTNPPNHLEEYKIPSYKCLIEHGFMFKHWNHYSWLERLDHLVSLLPNFISKLFFKRIRGGYC